MPAKKTKMPDHVHRKHRRLSASKAKLWMTCPGSLENAEKYVSPTNEAAARGTAAHELADVILSSAIDYRKTLGAKAEKPKRAAEYIGNTIEVTCDVTGKVFSFLVDKEMANHVQGYVDVIMARASNETTADVFCELACDASAIYGDLGGTADAVIVYPEARRIIVSDLKYGFAPVEVEENPQLIIYLLGVLLWARKNWPGVEWQQLRSMIYQPRGDHPGGIMREQTLYPEDLRRWANDLRSAGQKADAPNPDYIPGGHCAGLYCPKIGTCASYARHVQGVAKTDFSTMDFNPPELSEMEPEQVAALVLHRPAIKKWLDSVTEQATLDVRNTGLILPGLVLSEGRGQNSWRDLADIEKRLVSQFKKKNADVSDLYQTGFKSPNQIKELMKAKGASAEKIAAFLKENTRRTPGAPVLVPEDAARGKLGNTAKNEFAPVGHGASKRQKKGRVAAPIDPLFT